MLVRQFSIEGLGHLSTLIADETAGLAAIVDPRRDVDVYLRAAAAHDLVISHVFETHLHNDYVSGARELAAITGAVHVIGAGAELAYGHRPVRGGERITVGHLDFAVLETPGHTPEHVAYAVADTTRAGEPLLMLTGGSLLVGAVGRTDLLRPEDARPYADAMFASLHETVLRHEDFVAVYPTHGAGSLCSTGIASTPWSTIGFERRHNRMLQPRDVDAFARRLLRGQPAVPRYFARMRPLNQHGPRPIGVGPPEPRPLDVAATRAAIAAGAAVVDLRDAAAHAVEHVPGSFSIPAGSSFGTWLGWVVEDDRPMVFVLDEASDWDDAIRQALRVGHDSVLGHLRGGVRAWIESGEPIESGRRVTVDQLARAVTSGGPEAPLVVDVRQATEFASGHIPGSWHIAAGSLTDRLGDLPRGRPIATICASGYRASVAASLLAQAGFDAVSSVADGMVAWTAQGHPVERGATDVAIRGDGWAAGEEPDPLNTASRHHTHAG